MPRRPQPLPPPLRDAAFTVAQGRSLGIGRGRLRGTDLDRPFHGIRVATFPGGNGSSGLPDAEPVWQPVDHQQLLRRCSALLVAMPDGAFVSHLSAAQLWPVPLPARSGDTAIHVTVRPPQRPPRRAGVIGHELTDRRTVTGQRFGLPVVDAATMFCQLASALSLPDLVAVGDALVLEPVYGDWTDDRPWVGLGQLAERVDLYRARGKVAAARAVRLIRPGAESRPETLVRMAILAAGLPEPEVNGNICDADGRFIGRGDLVYRRWKVVVEYDGDQHRTSTRQFDKDVLRLEGFAVAGWTVVRVVGRSFFSDRAGCLARITRALVEAGWRA